MQITQLETVVLNQFPHVVFVQLDTDAGLAGLGETSFGSPELVSYLHDAVAPRLRGRDPAAIEAIRLELTGLRLKGLGSRGTGVEVRSASAVDIALWDLLGKATNRAVYQLLGGATRDAIRVYNTCAGYAIPGGSATPEIRGPYDDLYAWLRGDAGELALDLLEHGVTAMKMWPFDGYAQMSGGSAISAADLDQGLEPFRQVRRAVGNRMDLLLELHGLWNLAMALRIARAFETEGLELFWIEDALLPDDISSLAEFARATRSPTAASELLGGRQTFRELLEARAADVVLFELCWCGGLSEGKAIAILAEAFGRPVAPHDGTGPVGWTAGVHLAVHAPNAMIQESVRSLYTGWYDEVVTQLPRVSSGFVRPPAGPGLGLELRPEVHKRSDAEIRVTRLE